ncbi:MAG: hypothetical protein V7641_4234 [Blastocatellia bacterium]
MPNLNFENSNTLYASHGLHAYAAKCPPQLVRYGLQYYSSPRETVLDPMVGSGTTLVEARLMGRNSIGFDIDPLACLIAKVKSSVLPDNKIEDPFKSIVKKFERDLKSWLATTNHSTALKKRLQPPEFSGRDYWFAQDISVRLALLAYYIAAEPMKDDIRDFFWVAFSSLILAKTSVASARDIVHSRPHYWEHAETPNVIAKFKSRVQIMRKQMIQFADLCRRSSDVKVVTRLGDARRIRRRDESVDLIFTSPPYVTALDYPRAHFLAVAWMEQILGVSLSEYRKHGQAYIGSERLIPSGDFLIDQQIGNFDLTCSTLGRLAKRSEKHAKLTQRYFLDMYDTLAEMHRVLKLGRHAILVVCPSHIRKIAVPTQTIFIEMCDALGFKLKQQCTRSISKAKRILPYMQKSFGKRMMTEYVLVFQKTE